MVIQVLRTNKSAKTPESEAAAARPPPTAEPPSRVANERPNPNPSRRGRCVHVLSSKPMLTRAYGIFDLSYGTMLIAIHDVLWSAVVVYLLVLGTAHSREVTRIVEGDMQAHLMERAVHALPEKEVMAPRGQLGHENRSYYMRYVEFAFEQAKSVINQDNEQIKLTSGLHLATMLTMMMVFGITMAAIDMMASMMLLAGALLYIRQLMMPWLSLRLIEMMMLVLFAFTALGFPHGLVFWKIFIVMFFALCIVFYHWLVAYSFHEHLCRPERTGLVHHTRPANPHSAVCTYPRAVPGGIILSVGGANVVRRFEGNTDADPSEAADLNPTETRTQMYI